MRLQIRQHQRLIFDGRILSPSDAIGEHSVYRACTFHLVAVDARGTGGFVESNSGSASQFKVV